MPTSPIEILESLPAGPPGREHVAHVLEGLGLAERAWWVGGDVRDRRAGLDSKDIDVLVTGLLADDLRTRLAPVGDVEILAVGTDVAAGPDGPALHRREIGVRVRHPAWAPAGGVEFALARRERSTGPRHTDFEIVPGIDVTVEDDLARRDWTINAVAENVGTGEICDPFGGLDDLRDRILRPVSDHTCAEDPLRILRGARHAAKLDLQLSDAAREQFVANAASVRHLSGERVWGELWKLLALPNAAVGVRLLSEAGVIGALWPAWATARDFDQRSPHHDLTVGEHTLKALEAADRIGAPPVVKLALLAHDVGKPDAAHPNPKDPERLRFHADPSVPGARAHEEHSADHAADLLERLRAPSDISARTVTLVREHMFRTDDAFVSSSPRKQATKARRFLHRYGRDLSADLLLLRRSDRAAKRGGPLRDKDLRPSPFELEVSAQMGQPVELRDMRLRGDRVVARGLKGPQVGEALQRLHLELLATEDPAAFNTEEHLEAWLERVVRDIQADER